MSATTRSWVMYDQAETSGDGTPTTLVGCLVGLPTTPLESAARATSEARRLKLNQCAQHTPTPSSIGTQMWPNGRRCAILRLVKTTPRSGQAGGFLAGVACQSQAPQGVSRLQPLPVLHLPTSGRQRRIMRRGLSSNR
jgi:hypothetical protein